MDLEPACEEILETGETHLGEDSYALGAAATEVNERPPAGQTDDRDAPGVAGGPGSISKKEDPRLGELALPAAAIRRAARSAAPGVRFSKEAIAGLHRIAQAFICFATERALIESSKQEAEKAKKAKGKNNPTARKTLSADHMMKFLTGDLPPIGKRVASLFPDLMPVDYKPVAVRLLELLQEQDKASKHVENAGQNECLGEGPAAEAEVEPADRRQVAEGKRKKANKTSEQASKKAKTTGSAGTAKAKTSGSAGSAPLERFLGRPSPAVQTSLPEEVAVVRENEAAGGA